MKRLLLMIAAVICVATLSVAERADASFTNRSPGDPITANGDLVISGAIIGGACAFTMSGTVSDPRSASVVITGGTMSRCSDVTLDVRGFPWGKTQHLDGTWSVGAMVVQMTGVSGAFRCLYSGALSGTWSSDGVNTYLTVTGNTLRLVRNDGVLPCASAPGVSGDMALLGVASA